MNLNDWLLFIQIVEAGGLSAASRLTGLPRSTLSRRLSCLEETLGYRVLIRRGRAFRLTDEGRAFYQEALQIDKQVGAARERLLALTAEEGGTLRMTAPKATGGYFLGNWLAAFIQRHPKIRIELNLSDDFVNIFEQGYDLALRVGPLTDSSLIARKLGTSKRFLVAAPCYRSPDPLPATPSSLPRHRCIGFGKQRSGLIVWTLSRGNETERITVDPILQCDDMVTTLSAVESGLGIAMIPAFVCQESLKQGRLVRVLPQWEAPAAAFFLVYPDRKLMPKRLRLLIDFLLLRTKTDTGWQGDAGSERGFPG